MAITAENYEKAKAYAGREGLSDAVRQKLLSELDAYESGYQKKIEDATPAEYKGPATVKPAAAPTEEQLVASLKGSLDPRLPLPAQALAVQPATTHPGGDKAAEDEWLRKPGTSSDGAPVIVYDMPIAMVRKKLLEQPELIAALGYHDFIPHPQDIVKLQPDDSLTQAAQDYFWRQHADEITKSGRVAYRYSKAPWLQGGSLGGALDTLSTKLKGAVNPAIEGTTAFVMGVDNTAAFGAGRAIGETVDTKLHPEGQGDAPEGTAGGIASAKGASPTEVNDMINEEHPYMYGAGQVLGIAPNLIKKGVTKLAGAVSPAAEKSVEGGIRALRAWSPSNALFDLIAEAAEGVGKRLPETGLMGAAARVGTGALAGAVGAAAQQGLTEGVDAAAEYAQGRPSTELSERGSRVLDALESGAKWGGALPAVAEAAGGLGRWTRTGPRYRGLPGELEAAGVEPRVGRGYVAPKEVEAAEQEARTIGNTTTEDVLAHRVAPKIEEAGKAIGSESRAQTAAENTAFQATPEGQEALPLTNFTQRAVEKLRDAMQKREQGARLGKGEVPDPVGTPGTGADVRKVFNQQIDDVSLSPVEGAVALSPEEAEAFLDEKAQRLLRRDKVNKAPAGGPKEPFAPAADTGTLEAHRTIPVRGEPTPPPPVERPTLPGPGRFQAPEGVLGEPLPARASSAKGPTEPALVEPPVPSRPTTTVNPDVPAGTPQDAARFVQGSAGQPAAPAPAKPGRAPAESKARGGGPLAQSLRKRGVEQVYVVPRKVDAQHTERLLDELGAYRDKSGDPAFRDLDEAVRQDRDVRGGGYSAFKNQQSERIGQAQEVARHAAPPNGSTYHAVAGFARGGKGDLDRTLALRAAADKAGPGVRQELEQTRVPVLLKKLENLNAVTRKRPGESLMGIPGRVVDAAHMRFAYPVLRQLEGPLGDLRMQGGRGAAVSDRAGDARRTERNDAAGQGFEERRAAALEAERQKRLPPKKKRRRRPQ